MAILQGDFTRRLARNKMAMAGLVVVAILFVVAFLANQLSPYPPDEINTSQILAPPNSAHVMGTDVLGPRCSFQNYSRFRSLPERGICGCRHIHLDRRASWSHGRVLRRDGGTHNHAFRGHNAMFSHILSYSRGYSVHWVEHLEHYGGHWRYIMDGGHSIGASRVPQHPGA